MFRELPEPRILSPILAHSNPTTFGRFKTSHSFRNADESARFTRRRPSLKDSQHNQAVPHCCVDDHVIAIAIQEWDRRALGLARSDLSVMCCCGAE